MKNADAVPVHPGVFLLILLSSLFLLACSTTRTITPEVMVSESLLINHVENIINTPSPRNYRNIGSLNQVAAYIESEFSKHTENVGIQEYLVNGEKYKNIICSFGSPEGERIIVGAHYDVCGNQDGADDNAGAVAGLLELARLLRTYPEDSEYGIDLVAYSLEEPPFFRTKFMGSAVHADYLKNKDIKVKVMICLEMIGYYTEAEDSQKYPIGIMKWFYPDKGNFITVASNLKSYFAASRIAKSMRKNSDIKVCRFAGPSSFGGIDLSDHANYWENGFKAVMITDTSFFRNPNYHRETDTIETLNFAKMAEVVKGVYASLILM